MPWVDPDISALPNCQTHPLEWMRATDTVTKRRFDTSHPLEADSNRGQPESFFKSLMNVDVLQEIVGARRLVCVAHLSLSRRIVELLTEGDFEKTWLELGAEGHRKHFIIAFQKLEEHSDPMGMFNNTKINTPELCYDEISRDGGRGFLELLKMFLLPNNEVAPTRPYVLPSARYDALIGWQENDTAENRKAWLGLRRIMRTRYISGFLAIVLHSVEGRDITFVSYTHEHHKTKDTLLGMKPVMDDVLGESDASKWRKEQAERRKEMKLFCDACLQPEEKSENGKMSICSPCKAVGRDVRYCDRACQKKAWKSHKRECGKPLGLSAVFDDVFPVVADGAVVSRPDIPPVAPGHRRTADLLRQIGLLNDNPKKDYLIILSSRAEDAYVDINGISLDEPQGAATFVIMRSRAMASGGPRAEAALLYVYRVLQNYGGDDAVLRGQLRKEYGETFDRMLATLRKGAPPSYDEVPREEIDAVLRMLRKLGRFEEELAGYVSGTGRTAKLGMQVGPKKDLMVVVNYPFDALPPIASVTPIPTISSYIPVKDAGPNFGS
ncbi:hypothetical protein B0H10DRAFT_1816854 [Mycena sp. CBHHK59/15]|nr:hypothetical protein B0H10DRAFT_1816854 [Mycena sp. CBHHK59/15]